MSRMRMVTSQLTMRPHYGYTDVLSKLQELGVKSDAPNGLGHTPLMYAVLYGQREAAQHLWKQVKDNLGVDSGHFGDLVRELCTIGIDISLPPNETVSGFRVKNHDGNWYSHPRALEIGKELCQIEEFDGMQRAAEAVCKILGERAANKLSSCWHGLDGWMH